MKLQSEPRLALMAVKSFDRADRARGELLYREQAVFIDTIGTRGASSSVLGNSASAYDVVLDFSKLQKGILGGHCDCPRFETTNCKHLWAMMLACQKYDIPLPPKALLKFVPIDPDSLQFGEPLTQATSGTTSQSPARIPTANANAQAPQPQPTWRSKLLSITENQTASPHAIPTPSFHQEAMLSAKHWFVISLSDFAIPQPLKIYTYLATRLQSGRYGKPVIRSIQASAKKIFDDPSEQTAFALLEPFEDPFAPSYYFLSDPASSKFQLRSGLTWEGVRALSGTGRLAWTMSAGHGLEDPQRLEFDGDQPWALHLAIQPAASITKERMITVTPWLVRGEERIPFQELVGVSTDGVIVRQNRIGLTPAPQAHLVRGFHQTGELEVPLDELETLLEQLGQWLWPVVEIDPSLDVRVANQSPAPRLHLTTPQEGLDHLRADVIMKYGDVHLPAHPPGHVHWDSAAETLVNRRLDDEEALLNQLPIDLVHAVAAEANATGAKNNALANRSYEHRKAQTSSSIASQSRSFLRSIEHLSIPRGSLSEVVTHLTKLGWEVLADGRVFRSAGDFNIQVISGMDWFDVHAEADFDGLRVSLPELLKAHRKGEKFVLLDDGSHGLLPEAWLARFRCLEQGGTTEKDSIRYHKSQALLLESILAEHDTVSLDAMFRNWCKKLHSFTGIRPTAPPRSFQGQLRDYQQHGLGWLHFLNEFKLGGCLADDMGLGKTIQVLAILEKRRTRKVPAPESRSPSLVVAPKSLIFNWLEEASRFAPRLKVLDYTGTERKQHRRSFDSFDVILTTYGTLRIDALDLRQQRFDYVILDEAQAIKNPQSLAARAARLMQSEHRLVMTGTPVENHLGDLWSLFDFLNPGMLGRTRWNAKANIAAGNSHSDLADQQLKHISKALRPLILRRTKKEVLRELPEKCEQTLSCDMEGKQRKLYNELRDHYRRILTGRLAKEGMAKSKIQILEALLRLRQAACDPRLVNPKCNVRGVKINLLLEQLEEVTSEGHKALVFSQFTSLLALLRSDLDARKVDYEYLDGSSRGRKASVARFQTDERCKLFLISLKAGGYGLNLTAADYVYILDPWWNPAVEAQAVDRAHRIGQANPVNAYRMICRDTVEEKIMELQASKRKLADAIISNQQSLISELTSEDLKILLQ